MVANNALSQYGTHTPFLIPSQVSLPFPWSLLFASCGTFPLPPFFIHISCHSPPFIQQGDLESTVSSPGGSARSPASKCNWVNSGPRNERFLACQSGKRNYSVQENSLLFLLLITDSMNCSDKLTNAILTNVSK